MEDDLDAARGVVNGVLLSIPLWAAIILAINLIRSWI